MPLAQGRWEVERCRLAFDVREHLSARAVESDDTRCAVEAGVLQVPEQCMYDGRPRTCPSMHIALNAHGLSDQPAQESFPMGSSDTPGGYVTCGRTEVALRRSPAEADLVAIGVPIDRLARLVGIGDLLSRLDAARGDLLRRLRPTPLHPERLDVPG